MTSTSTARSETHLRAVRVAILVVGVAAISGASGCAGAAAEGADSAPNSSQPGSAACAAAFDAAPVRQVLDDQAAAWNRGDLDGFLGGYERSPALLFTSGGRIREGFAETSRVYRARYGEDQASMGRLAFELLDVRGLGACHDTAVVLGRWRVTGVPVAGSGVFTVILGRGPGGAWAIVHDHTSADPEDGGAGENPDRDAGTSNPGPE